MHPGNMEIPRSTANQPRGRMTYVDVIGKGLPGDMRGCVLLETPTIVGALQDSRALIIRDQLLSTQGLWVSEYHCFIQRSF